MDYEFTCDVRTFDYWKLSMFNTYSSMVGVVNIIFFVSMILVCKLFFNQVGYGLQTVMFIGVLLVPLVQPFGVYMKAKTQMALTPKGTHLAFGKKGMVITLKDKHQTITWDKIVAVTERAGMVIIYSDGAHGYILTPHVLGSKKKEFVKYLKLHQGRC